MRWRGRVIARDPSLSRVSPVLVMGLASAEREEVRRCAKKDKRRARQAHCPSPATRPSRQILGAMFPVAPTSDDQ